MESSRPILIATSRRSRRRPEIKTNVLYYGENLDILRRYLPFSWASDQITITNQAPTGFTIHWHDRARRSARPSYPPDRLPGAPLGAKITLPPATDTICGEVGEAGGA